MQKIIKQLLLATASTCIACVPAYASNISYSNTDTQDGVSISYTIITNGNIGVLALSDIVSSSITFTGSSASRYGKFDSFTALNSLYFSNDSGVVPVSATVNNLLFDFGHGGGLNFDFQSFVDAEGRQQSFAYALAAKGISDGDAVVYGHGDLATRELDNPEFDGTYNNLGSTTYTVVDPTVQVFATADAAAVPEPASWAMMIAGFGLIGTAMRRHRVTLSFA